jgi:hypothetical protein
MTRADLPVTRRVVRGVGLGFAVVVSLAAISSCGSDVPSKADFATEIGKVTGGRVSPDLAGCVYDKLQNDTALLRRAIATPDLSKDEDDKMTKLLAQCVLARDSSSSKKTTTTTSSGGG